MLKILICAAIAGLASVPFQITAKSCDIKVLTDVYFRSMTEVAGEKNYPEVVILENEDIQVWSVPNRGRILFDLIYKLTGHSQLYSERNPLPLRFRSGYTFEFGGVYTTFPWQKRDNVPLPLAMETATYEDRCALFMWTEDPETGILVHTTLTVFDKGAYCTLSFELINPSSIDRKVNFSVVIVARPGGGASEETKLLIPTHAVVVGESQAEWMGKGGTEVAWPASWSEWGAFKGAGSFSFDLRTLSSPTIGVLNPLTGEELRIAWEEGDPWMSCDIFSWGPTYTKTMGAYDGFRIELVAKDMVITGGSKQVLHLLVSIVEH